MAEWSLVIHNYFQLWDATLDQYVASSWRFVSFFFYYLEKMQDVKTRIGEGKKKPQMKKRKHDVERPER